MTAPVTIRLASAADALPAREGAPRLTGHVLLAEQAGAPIAAVSIETGAAVGDRSRVRLLRLRRYQLLSQSAGLAAGWLTFGHLAQRSP